MQQKRFPTELERTYARRREIALKVSRTLDYYRVYFLRPADEIQGQEYIVIRASNYREALATAQRDFDKANNKRFFTITTYLTKIADSGWLTLDNFCVSEASEAIPYAPLKENLAYSERHLGWAIERINPELFVMHIQDELDYRKTIPNPWNLDNTDNRNISKFRIVVKKSDAGHYEALVQEYIDANITRDKWVNRTVDFSSNIESAKTHLLAIWSKKRGMLDNCKKRGAFAA